MTLSRFMPITKKTTTMGNTKPSLVTYKREKDKVEISGEAKDTKGLMWADMISSKLWVLLIIVLLLTVPKASFILAVWQLLKNKLFLSIPFVVAADLLFSG